jgi:hypothetical protein
MINQTKLLLLLAVLAVLRFVLVPVLDYQAETKVQLELVTQQLDKAEQLMHSKEQLQQAKVASEEQLGRLSQVFLKDDNAAQFRLNQQQFIQQQVQQFQTEVSFFDWLGQTQLSRGQIEVHQARVTLEGNFTDLMQAYTDVVAVMPIVRVTEFELIRNQGRKSKKQSAAAPKGSLTLMLEYSRLVKEPT